MSKKPSKQDASAELVECEKTVADLQQIIKGYDEHRQGLETEIAAQQRRIDTLEQDLRSRDATIDALRADNASIVASLRRAEEETAVVSLRLDDRSADLAIARDAALDLALMLRLERAEQRRVAKRDAEDKVRARFRPAGEETPF